MKAQYNINIPPPIMLPANDASVQRVGGGVLAKARDQRAGFYRKTRRGVSRPPPPPPNREGGVGGTPPLLPELLLVPIKPCQRGRLGVGSHAAVKGSVDPLRPPPPPLGRRIRMSTGGIRWRGHEMVRLI